MVGAVMATSCASAIEPYAQLSSATSLQAQVSGETLLVAYNDGSGIEMCYRFQKCMENNLYTFYRVGYRKVTRTAPKVDGIAGGTGITWLNSTASDNIGPLSIQGGGWTGGNHTLNGERTATTKAVKIMADGREITAKSGIVNCAAVDVQVTNDIYNPVGVAKGAKPTKVLLAEVVNYRVEGNSIDVKLTHTFAQGTNVRVSRYYGMQSMFVKEDYVMTPHGKFTRFTPVTQLTRFGRADYPAFDRFIELRSSLGWCQAAYVQPDGLGGARRFSTPNADEFIYSTGKCYHVLISGFQAKGGTTYSWHGTYSWFKPLRNDDDVLAYTVWLNGKEVLFVDTKRRCDVVLAKPLQWSGKIEMLQCDEGLKTSLVSGSQIRVVAQEASSAILRQAPSTIGY